MKIVVLLLPLLLSLLYKFILTHAISSKTSIYQPYPSAEDALKGPEKARVYTRPSDGGLLEYFSVYSTDRNEGRSKTAIVIFHPSWSTGYLPCRYKFSALSNLLSVFSQTDISLICPTHPGFGGSSPTVSDGDGEFVEDVVSLLKSLGFTSVASIGWGMGSTSATRLANFERQDLDVIGVALLQPTEKSNIARHESQNPIEKFFPSLTTILDFISASSLHSKLLSNQTPALQNNHHQALKDLKIHSPDALPLFVTDLKRVLRHSLFSQMTDIISNISLNKLNVPTLNYCWTKTKSSASTSGSSGCHGIAARIEEMTKAYTFDYDSVSEIAVPLETAVYELIKRSKVGEGRWEDGDSLVNSNSI
ncbi:hypothetical protein TL16_g03693 [Triparma laevis f. inornata]|uniref:AB hydrolase-1 domain-containing protein n=2 Tax=Triparma laevis TaxID=1534972 RepID=A0A9W7KW23_9STRA|nr:hypothetical protein TL16_g03693 [Triparma laevis f. inornata]GMI13802.1 hypothetical protein TrLO_g925 [Triparma laevis f. longispina]